MGTDCLYVFKYNNIYYIYMKGNDSHPSRFGKTIVNELQQMSAEDYIQLKNNLRAIDTHYTSYESYCGFTSLVHSTRNPHKYVFYISSTEPELYIGISYIYIIDMDKNVFNVKWYGETRLNTDLYDLNNIPESWDCLVDHSDE